MFTEWELSRHTNGIAPCFSIKRGQFKGQGIGPHLESVTSRKKDRNVFAFLKQTGDIKTRRQKPCCNFQTLWIQRPHRDLQVTRMHRTAARRNPLMKTAALHPPAAARSEERRVGKEYVSTCRSR